MSAVETRQKVSARQIRRSRCRAAPCADSEHARARAHKGRYHVASLSTECQHGRAAIRMTIVTAKWTSSGATRGARTPPRALVIGRSSARSDAHSPLRSLEVPGDHSLLAVQEIKPEEDRTAQRWKRRERRLAAPRSALKRVKCAHAHNYSGSMADAASSAPQCRRLLGGAGRGDADAGAACSAAAPRQLPAAPPQNPLGKRRRAWLTICWRAAWRRRAEASRDEAAPGAVAVAAPPPASTSSGSCSATSR